ncbi:MAG: serine/threonine protein kinase [Streptosporangiaceae bacterium]|nr:serine/threonine protein kinase [Streptosporangiaceae bacterium]
MQTASVKMLGERYRLVERLASGGMGEVWRAQDVVVDRQVAVKLLRPEYADSTEFRDRLRSEGRLVANLSHPGIVQVYDHGDSENGEPYLAMEFVDGEPLSAVLAREGTLAPAHVLDIVAQVSDGLDAAHRAGLVHRDIKPGNLLVDGRTIKITDFGIALASDAAALTRTGMVLGTPQYLSPERASGRMATAPSDLYSLGIIAFQGLAGRPPFEGSPLGVVVAHRDTPLPPLPPGVPPPVAELVEALTAKDPAARPAGAQAVAEWARRLLADPEIAGAPAVPPGDTHLVSTTYGDAGGRQSQPPARTFKQRGRRAAATVAAAMLVLVGGTAGWTLRHPVPVKPAAAQTVTVAVDTYIGRPVADAVERLHALGLRTTVRPQADPGHRDVVVGIAPSGTVPAGTTVTVLAAAAEPARSRPPADKDDTRPKSTRVRHSVAGTPQTHRVQPARPVHVNNQSRDYIKRWKKGHGAGKGQSDDHGDKGSGHGRGHD